jgi:hypothetical protein
MVETWADAGEAGDDMVGDDMVGNVDAVGKRVRG